MLPSYSPSRLSLGSLALLVTLASPVKAKQPFDIQLALHYLPSKAIGAAGFAIYFVLSSLLLWRLVRNRDWWGLCLPIGGYGEALGFLLRVFIGQPKLRTSLGFYIAMDLFIVLSPALFLTFNYILYGRLICLAVGRAHSFIRPERVATMFVLSNAFTFMLQGSGGSLRVQQDTAALGRDVFLIGTIAQGLWYAIYDVLLALSHRSILKTAKATNQPRDEPWWRIFHLIYFSSLFIIIRSIYRVAETAEGQGGYLMTHEWCFLAFDSIPLAIGIAVYIFWWPGNYLPAPCTLQNPSLDSVPKAAATATQQQCRMAHLATAA
ncbi:RTA1 like protein-domain-containing protein [Gautieria morchelliformis]|nr:RTA1 like protein-domain-containing protein [Gautieria morchelliformis]